MAKSFYKIIDGVKYDRSVLEQADELIKGQGDGRISRDDIKQLFKDTQDGPGITEIEHGTLDYIANNYNMTDAARDWLKSSLKGNKPAFKEKDNSASNAGSSSNKKGMPRWLKILLIILLIVVIIIILLYLLKGCDNTKSGTVTNSDTSEIRENAPKQSELISPTPVKPESGVYTVKQGDSLAEISDDKYGNKKDWILIYNKNKDQIKDEDEILPGQRLIIPEK